MSQGQTAATHDLEAGVAGNDQQGVKNE